MKIRILSAGMLGLSLFIAACQAETPSNPSEKAPSVQAVSISHGWIRETPPGAKVAAAFFQIENPSTEAIRIISAKFDSVGRSEIHSMSMQDGMMRMRKLDSLEIPAQSRHTLGPGSDHLMLFDLQGPLQSGAQLQGSLQLEDGREIALNLPVRSTAPSN